jgi:hypothetical protein
MSTVVAKNVQVGTSGTATDNFTIRQPATPDGTVRIANGNSGTTTDLVTVTSAGNVGIGTSSPAAKLNVDSGSTGLMSVFDTTNANGGYILGRSSGTAVWDFGTAKQTIGVGGATDLGINVRSGFMAFGTGNTERARIDSSGNLGLGTSSPTSRLNVSGAANNVNSEIKIEAGGVASGYLGSNANGFNIGTDTGSVIFKTGVTGGGSVGATGSERARIDSSGRLLVGVTSPLTGNFNNLINSSSESTVLISKSSGTASHLPLALLNTATSGDNKFTQFFTEASPVLRGEITYNRTAGLTAYNTTSDYRAKDISGPVVDSGTLIDSTPVYMGKMKGATQERPMFIAHEVPAYAHTGEKDAVDADGNPVYQQMDASALIPVMWAEIQSLRARVAALESK